MTRMTSRFDAQSTALDVVEGCDLTGKVAVVTGASSGIGIETARALANAGAHVVLGVRNREAGLTIAAELHGATGNPEIEVGVLDLSDFNSVRGFAQDLRARLSKLDLLVNNAGISQTPQTHQADGYELRFATNHMGHFLLAHLLRDKLEAAAPARMVVVSSAAHKGCPINFDDIHFRKRPHEIFKAYGESKTANVLFACETTRRFGARGIFSNALMPGSILTGLQRHHGDQLMRQIGFLQADGTPNPIMKTPEQGAATSVWAATAPELENIGGLMLEDCAEALPAAPDRHPWVGFEPHIFDAEAAARLWIETERMLGLSAEGPR